MSAPEVSHETDGPVAGVAASRCGGRLRLQSAIAN